MDLAKKLLRNISTSYPISYTHAEIEEYRKEAEKLTDLEILQSKTSLTLACPKCRESCPIKRLDSGKRAILCISCEDARLHILTENDGIEYAVSLENLLKHLLSALDFSMEEPKPMVRERLWSLGIQEINGAAREVLYLREPQDAETDVFTLLEQKKALHPIVFSTVSHQRLLNTKITLIPLENLLTAKGDNLFSKAMFDRIIGEGGTTVGREGIELGESGLVLDKTALLHSPDAFGNYKSEKLEPLERHLIENLWRRGMADKNKWHTRKELAERLGVTPHSLSNALTRIRAIAKHSGIEVVEQSTRTKGYRINPDLLPK